MPVTLAPTSPETDWHHLTDEEFVQSVEWEDEADPALIAAAKSGKLKSFWETLTESVFGLGARVNRRKAWERRFGTGLALWSQPFFEETERERQLADLWGTIADRLESSRQAMLEHLTRKKQPAKNGKADQSTPHIVRIPRKINSGLQSWLEESSEPPSVWEQVVLTDLLRHAGPSLSAKVGVPLWRRLLEAASQWTALEMATNDEDDPPGELEAIQSGELPWTWGLLFSHVRGARTLCAEGAQVLQRHLDQHTDTDGTPRAETMQRMGTWLPPFARAVEWSYAAEQPLWEDSFDERFQSLLSRVAGAFTGDGHLGLNGSPGTNMLPVLLTASRAAGIGKRNWPVKFLLDVSEHHPEYLGQPVAKKQGTKAKTGRQRTVDTSEEAMHQSDWARVACLRNHAGRSADVFSVAHHQPFPWLDFSPFGDAVIQGPWEFQVRADGKPLDPPEEWTCVCWHTDSDGDYLELQHTIDENRRMERQVFLSRTDHFLVMADCISGFEESSLEYTAKLPVVENIKVTRQPQTREQILERGETWIRSFPLALPEDIVQSTAGKWDFNADDNGSFLKLHQVGIGGVYAPVVFDWTPARTNSDADWRVLTVTENGPKIPRQRAAGQRIRMGNQQLLIYRSLAPTDELRTVLGHHTGHETIIARFTKGGDVKPLLIVE